MGSENSETAVMLWVSVPAGPTSQWLFIWEWALSLAIAALESAQRPQVWFSIGLLLSTVTRMALPELHHTAAPTLGTVTVKALPERATVLFQASGPYGSTTAVPLKRLSAGFRNISRMPAPGSRIATASVVVTVTPLVLRTWTSKIMCSGIPVASRQSLVNRYSHCPWKWKTWPSNER